MKNHLPELFAAAQKRFLPEAPHQVFRHGEDRVEIWDADDFDPWGTLRWETVRVVRYRQYNPKGTVYEAYWLTDFPRHWVSSRAVFRMAKSRWEIENQGFNPSADGPRTATGSNTSALMSAIRQLADWWSGF